MKDTPLDFIVYSLLKKVIERSNIDPQMVEDICLGNVGFTCLGSGDDTSMLSLQLGQQRKGSLHRPRSIPRRRLPKHNRRLLRQPLLLFRIEGCTRYCEPDQLGKH